MARFSIATSLRVVIFSLCIAVPPVVHADTFVCTAGDVGCVIASMAKSNANGPGHDYISLNAGTYTLTRVDNAALDGDGKNGLPAVTGALTIFGPGQGVTLIHRAEGAPFFRIIEVAPTGGLTIAGVTIMNGDTDIRFFFAGGCRPYRRERAINGNKAL